MLKTLRVAKLLALFLLGILCAGQAFAFQQQLTSFGFKELSVSGAAARQCEEFTISLPSDAQNDNAPIFLSLQAEMSPYLNDTTFVSVSFNDSDEKILWPEKFYGEDAKWARVFVPKFLGNQKVTLCAVLGGSTQSLKITKNSFLGSADSPVLSIQNDAPQSIFLGDRAKMSIIVSNAGTQPADVFVQFVHPDTRAKVQITSFDIVEGDSSAMTTLIPGETKKFDYYIKPSILSSFNLPSAALFFTNSFGEKEVIISNHPQMAVLDPRHITLSLVSLSDDQPYSFKVILKNNWLEPFSGTLILSPQTEVDSPSIPVAVSPLTEKELIFSTKDLQNGNYSFYATANDSNESFSSNTINVEVKQQQIPFEIIFPVLALIIGVAIFGWINYPKEK